MKTRTHPAYAMKCFNDWLLKVDLDDFERGYNLVKAAYPEDIDADDDLVEEFRQMKAQLKS